MINVNFVEIQTEAHLFVHCETKSFDCSVLFCSVQFRKQNSHLPKMQFPLPKLCSFAHLLSHVNTLKETNKLKYAFESVRKFANKNFNTNQRKTLNCTISLDELFAHFIHHKRNGTFSAKNAPSYWAKVRKSVSLFGFFWNAFLYCMAFLAKQHYKEQYHEYVQCFNKSPKAGQIIKIKNSRTNKKLKHFVSTQSQNKIALYAETLTNNDNKAINRTVPFQAQWTNLVIDVQIEKCPPIN